MAMSKTRDSKLVGISMEASSASDWARRMVEQDNSLPRLNLLPGKYILVHDLRFVPEYSVVEGVPQTLFRFAVAKGNERTTNIYMLSVPQASPLLKGIIESLSSNQSMMEIHVDSKGKISIADQNRDSKETLDQKKYVILDAYRKI